MQKFLTRSGKFVKGWYTYEYNLTDTGAYRFGYLERFINLNPNLVNNSHLIWEFFNELPKNAIVCKEGVKTISV